MRIAKNVLRLEAYVPGEQPRAKNVVKLNTNENPYPPSPEVAKILSSFDLDLLRRYPDPDFTALREAIAKQNGTTADCVFVGNGSDEILSLAAKAFVENDGSIGSLDPSYSLYKTLAAIRDVPWKASKRCSLFLWTNPNAPTGTMASVDEIAKFAKRFPGVVIVDEAYADFASDNAMRLATAKGNKNLIVMRTFSKSYSLAGLRVGYAVGPKELVDALFKVKDSYNVDAIAQAVALAAYNDQAWMKRNAAKIVKTRAFLVKELEKRGWNVMPSEANFIFAKPPEGKPDAKATFEALKKDFVFTRYFPGPKTGDRIRITVGTDEQTKKLLESIDASHKQA